MRKSSPNRISSADQIPSADRFPDVIRLAPGIKLPPAPAPTEFESVFYRENAEIRLIGIDEAGRGPIAGPVVAGAVFIHSRDIEEIRTTLLPMLTDSKQLSEARREESYHLIRSCPRIESASGIASPREIDTLNILHATHLAMARAIENLPGGKVDYAFVDGLPVRGLPCPHTAIVKGDARSFLIAAASIVAKVTRDHMLRELDQKYPQYGFARHKGYGTAEHLAALREYGPCPEHRRSFAPVDEILNPPMF